jgi:hypothetical protein
MALLTTLSFTTAKDVAKHMSVDDVLSKIVMGFKMAGTRVGKRDTERTASGKKGY